MPIDDHIDSLKILKLCFNCVGEDFLKNEIISYGIVGICSYCERKAKHYSLEKFSERIESAFAQHYIRTSDQPSSFQYTMLADKESSYEWERDGEPVIDAIMNAADISAEVASAIQRILEDKFAIFDPSEPYEESEFSSESYYEENATDDARWQEEWREFERSLKTEARFFSRTAASLLKSVFDNIDTMKTRDGRSLIVDAGPETGVTEVYRARCFQSNVINLKDRFVV